MMWRLGIIFALIVAAAVMAYQIGSRLSDEAIITIVGVTCGIAASVPISLGLLIALTRERSSYVPDDYAESYGYAESEPAPAPPQPPAQPPQIIVVAPPQAQLPPSLAPYGNYLAAPQNNALPAPMEERTFKIVGEDEGE